MDGRTCDVRIDASWDGWMEGTSDYAPPSFSGEGQSICVDGVGSGNGLELAMGRSGRIIG